MYSFKAVTDAIAGANTTAWMSVTDEAETLFGRGASGCAVDAVAVQQDGIVTAWL